MKLWIKVGAPIVIALSMIGAYAWYEIPITLYPSKHWKEKYQETPPVKLKLSMTKNAVDGMVSNQSDSVITSVVIHVRVKEIRKCGETLVNVFSDPDWEANCKKDSNHTVEDIVDGQAYECFHGELAPYNAARCYAAIAMEFDPSKQVWDFFVLKVKGKPSIDMFGVRKFFSMAKAPPCKDGSQTCKPWERDWSNTQLESGSTVTDQGTLIPPAKR